MPNSPRALVQSIYMKAPWLRKFVNTFLPGLEPRYLFSRDKRSVIHASVIWQEEGTHFVNSFEDISSPAARALGNDLVEVIPPDASVLDLCCNQGRFLRHLWEHGHRSLFGFDIMKPAVDHFYATYAEQMPEIEIKTSDAGEYLRAAEDAAFDYLITFSAALELIHPRNDLFHHLYRICRKGAVFVVNENGHAYPRFWHTAFRRAGFTIEKAQRIDEFTLFVLRKT